jgi:voltage-gated potassium channel
MASLAIYAAEHDAQPQVFKNAFSGLWWAVATLTTVGYGDIYPITILGRVFGALIALLGIGMVAIPTGIISSGLVDYLNSQKKDEAPEKTKEELEFSFCPHCGKKLN